MLEVTSELDAVFFALGGIFIVQTCCQHFGSLFEGVFGQRLETKVSVWLSVVVASLSRLSGSSIGLDPGFRSR